MDKTGKSLFNLTSQNNIGAIVPTCSNLDVSQARGIKREFSNVGHDIGSERWLCELTSSSAPFKKRKIYNINDEADNDKKQSFDDMLNTLKSLIRTKDRKDEYSLYCQKIKDTENINIQLNGNILHFALNNKDKNIAEFLLKSDANIDINAKNSHGYTPLLLAIKNGLSKDIIAFLLEHGANVNDKYKDGNTTLLFVLKRVRPSQEIINLLLEHGANVNYKDKDGDTPLLVALHRGISQEMLALLLEHGADINAQDENGSTPLLLALYYGLSQEIINLLLEHGANVNYKDKDGDTPLLVALHRGISQEMLALLLEHGANINAQDENGSTPLLLALYYGLSQEMINLLLEHGANVNDKDKDGDTPLLVALNRGISQEMLALLLEHGADIYAKNKYGNTPLQFLDIFKSSIGSIKFLHIYLEIELKKDTDVQELLSGFKSLYSILKKRINIDNLFEDHKKNKDLLFIITIIGEMKDPRHIEKFTEKFGFSPPKLDDFPSLQGQCAVVINRALQGRELGDYYPTPLKLFIKTYKLKEDPENFC